MYIYICIVLCRKIWKITLSDHFPTKVGGFLRPVGLEILPDTSIAPAAACAEDPGRLWLCVSTCVCTWILDLKMEAWRSIVSYSKPNSALKSWFCFFLRTKNRWNQLGHEMYLYVYWFRETFSENQCFILPRSTRLQIVTVVFFRTLILGIFPGTTIWAVLDWLMGFFGWAVGLVDWSVAGGLGRRQLSRIGWCVSYAESCRYSVQKTNKWGSWVPSWNLSNSARLASRQGLPVVNSSQLIWMLVDHIYIPSDSHW